MIKKIVIGYPPQESGKGYAFLGQNRQFQWGTTPWTAYPMVPASGATLLKSAGYQVAWLDGIWSKQNYSQWKKDLTDFSPDILFIETKTPVIKKHWQIINELKKEFPHLQIALFGDHVTALPQESIDNSLVDFILTGGDYDFLMLNLASHLSNPKQRLEAGIWQRAQGGKPAKSSGVFELKHNLNELPLIDRDLTCYQLYAYENSNYRRLPGTYTMFGRDCWWGQCTFCSWTTLYPGRCFRCVSPTHALDEIGELIGRYQIKEIMDDSGSFPIGAWLTEFCEGMISRGYHNKIRLSCNMRFNAGLGEKEYRLMGQAGFRFILYGLESVNQKTLDRINKNSTVDIIKPVLRYAKAAGLRPHITAMIGYPWETKIDAQNTLGFARDLFREGLADTLQATIVIPYPGTPLFKEAQANDWLKTDDWDRYDMREPILKTEMSDVEIKGLVQDLYKSILTPRFIVRKVTEGLTNVDDLKYYTRMGFKFFSKLTDFKK